MRVRISALVVALAVGIASVGCSSPLVVIMLASAIGMVLPAKGPREELTRIRSWFRLHPSSPAPSGPMQFCKAKARRVQRWLSVLLQERIARVSARAAVARR